MNKAHEFEGDFKRVLCVCTVGMLRSATAAWVLSNEPFNFNTRAVGTLECALIPVTIELIQWADEIICMEQSHKNVILFADEKFLENKPIHVLNIPDDFDFRDPVLINMITNICKGIFHV